MNQQIKGKAVVESCENLVIGGGLAGLTSANLLAKNGQEVVLIEKKVFPFQRVCGEYISNEVRDFLFREDLFPLDIQPSEINRFLFTDTNGNKTYMKLDLGGFGISRYVLDDFLVQRAKSNGVLVKEGIQVMGVEFDQKTDQFQVELSDGSEILANRVIGAFGKRSRLDKQLDRSFIKERSPYIGVKYHIRTEAERDVVALHNFDGGYCGINAIEEGKFNLCYLGSRDQLRDYGSIPELEEKVLWKNPILKQIFTGSEFLLEKPEVINEINFERKEPIENHILMIGDAAGLITPLCGNGMAMAIHAGKLAAEAILNGRSRAETEQRFEQSWRAAFEQRLWVGRNVQRLFGSKGASVFARKMIQFAPFLANKIMKNTHGKPI